VNTPVGLPIRDALFHTHLLGPTGVGKSTVMLNLICADMAAGQGLLLLDPKGDLATDVLARIPQERTGDVVVIDPTNPTPVGFNPLQGPLPDAAVRADGLLATFAHVFSRNWGIRSADIFHACFLTLAHIPDATLLWLPPLLTDPAFRRRVLAHVDDPIGVGGFWAQWDAKSVAQQSEEIAPVLNKLRQLIVRPGLRAILGQTQPRFTLTDLFTRRRIVIVSLNKGIIGTDAARLLGSLIIASLWQEILRRARLQPEARSTVCVYIDEAHDFLAGIPGDLSDVLAQSRSLGVAFVLAHQFTAQLSPMMRASLETNTRNTLAFTLAASDATSMAKQAPSLDAVDFQSLPAYHAYATLMQSGNSTGWFSLTTNPPPPALRDASEAYAASHTRYGIPAAQTDQAILDLTRPDHTGSRWHGTATEGGSDEGPIGRRRR